MDQATQLREMIKSQTMEKKCARVVTVTSGKGGVGKSSVSVNLAIKLSQLGQKVIILDADFGLANVEVMLGIRPQYNLADLMFKGKTLNNIITQGPGNIGFISGGSGIAELTHLTDEQITYLTQKLCELDEIADIIIIDTGAGISNSIMEFAAASSEVLLVVTPEPTSITDAYALIKSLNSNPSCCENKKIKLVANRVKSIKEGEELYKKLNTVVTRFLNNELDFFGAVPMDSNVSKALMKQTPFASVYPDCTAAISIEKMAAKLCDTDISVRQKGIAKLFSGLIKKR